MSGDQFQRLIETRIQHARRRAPSVCEPMPQLAESSPTKRPSNGVLKDLYLGQSVEGLDLPSEASLRDRISANEDFAPLATMLDTLLSELSMGLVRSYLASQPLELQGELCTIMVRDVTAEISFQRGEDAAISEFLSGVESVEGKTLRVAMEILIEKDDLVNDATNTLFRDLMLKIDLFMRDTGINYCRAW